MNERSWQRLPDNQKKAVTDAAAAAEKRGWQMSAEREKSGQRDAREERHDRRAAGRGDARGVRVGRQDDARRMAEVRRTRRRRDHQRLPGQSSPGTGGAQAPPALRRESGPRLARAPRARRPLPRERRARRASPSPAPASSCSCRSPAASSGILFRGADDIAAWLCAAAAFLALGHTFRKGELVRMTLALDRLPPAARWKAEVLVALGRHARRRLHGLRRARASCTRAGSSTRWRRA